MKTWTVGGLTHYIKECLELDPELQNLWLTGEILNYTRSAAGHIYFTLKDARATISCVMWRSSVGRLGWKPKQGDGAQAHGHISVYPSRGAYQLYVDELRPAGQGDLHARFEALKEKLRVEGLFDAERKQDLPRFPRTLGIVTSPQAAALRDVLNVLERRYPLVRVLLAPTLVQGDQAPPKIVDALKALDGRDDVDAILIVRGGGSLEELWAFNDERVARAIAGCRHPVVSGVGHETDFTIADLVADRRAPTPSVAAEMAVPDQADLRQSLGSWTGRLGASLDRRLGQPREALEQQEKALRRLSPQARVAIHRQEVDDLMRQGTRTLTHSLALRTAAVTGIKARLAALSPLATLERGYSVVRTEETGEIVRSADQVQAGDGLRIRVRDGEFGAVTTGDRLTDSRFSS